MPISTTPSGRRILEPPYTAEEIDAFHASYDRVEAISNRRPASRPQPVADRKRP